MVGIPFHMPLWRVPVSAAGVSCVALSGVSLLFVIVSRDGTTRRQCALLQARRREETWGGPEGGPLRPAVS